MKKDEGTSGLGVKRHHKPKLCSQRNFKKGMTTWRGTVHWGSGQLYSGSTKTTLGIRWEGEE
jgi:hypothetical protein